MADPGADAFPMRAAWRKRRGVGGNVSVPPQDQTLVFCRWNAAYFGSADRGGGLALYRRRGFYICLKYDIIPSLTVGKQKTVVKPVKSMLAAVFCFVAICAIVLYFYTMVNLFLLSA